MSKFKEFYRYSTGRDGNKRTLVLINRELVTCVTLTGTSPCVHFSGNNEVEYLENGCYDSLKAWLREGS